MKKNQLVNLDSLKNHVFLLVTKRPSLLFAPQYLKNAITTHIYDASTYFMVINLFILICNKHIIVPTMFSIINTRIPCTIDSTTFGLNQTKDYINSLIRG
jgi:hypothetical protein